MLTDLIVKFALWLYTKKHLKQEYLKDRIKGYKIVPDFKNSNELI